MYEAGHGFTLLEAGMEFMEGLNLEQMSNLSSVW